MSSSSWTEEAKTRLSGASPFSFRFLRIAVCERKESTTTVVWWSWKGMESAPNMSFRTRIFSGLLRPAAVATASTRQMSELLQARMVTSPKRG